MISRIGRIDDTQDGGLVADLTEEKVTECIGSDVALLRSGAQGVDGHLVPTMAKCCRGFLRVVVGDVAEVSNFLVQMEVVGSVVDAVGQRRAVGVGKTEVDDGAGNATGNGVCLVL